MKVSKNLDFFHIFLSQGNIQIIKKLINSNQPVQFKELKLLVNPKTTKKFSTRTISKNLRFLEDQEIIENKTIEKSKPKKQGYFVTQKGIESYYLVKETEDRYNKL